MHARAAAHESSPVFQRCFSLQLLVLCVGLFWSALASAAHTSIQCDAKTATVAGGGTVSIDVTDCATTIDFAYNGGVDGPVFPAHGTATLRISGSRWFADYSHGGNAATSDVFEFTDGAAGGRIVRVTVTITQPPSALTMSPAALPDGAVGLAYSQGLSTTGGVAPYSYAVTMGSLPPGLALSVGGALSGTPTTTGTFNFTITATDSTAGTALTVSRTHVVDVDDPRPVAVADTVSAFTGQTISIPVTINDQSVAPITSITITRFPIPGSAVASGLNILYTTPFGGTSRVTFEYVATSAGGTSAPATVTVNVTPNPMPTAISHYAATAPGTPVHVPLTIAATGAPFTGASVVSVSPANAGTTSISPQGPSNGYLLTFTPDPAFAGRAEVRYTLSNALGTSPPAVVTIDVFPRPDPALDPEVRGLVDAQMESTRRFSDGQVNNFQQRLERLHNGGEGGFDNGLGFAIDRPCIEPLVGSSLDPCQPDGGAFRDGNGLANRATEANTGGHRGAVGTWIGGTIRSGSHDGRNGGVDVDFETDGVSAGIDYRMSGQLVVGAGFGYGRDENAIGGDGSRVDGDARTLALYASYHPGAWFVDMLLGYQALDYDLRRYITETGGLARGEREGSQLFASVSLGTDIVGDDTLVTPYARLDLARARLDAYSETGDPLYALHFMAMDADNATANLGVRMQSLHDLDRGRITPQFRLEYQRDLGGSSEAVIRYADLIDGPTYGLPSNGFNSSRVVVGLGALLDFDSGWGWGVEYRAQVGSSGDSDSGLSLRLKKDF